MIKEMNDKIKKAFIGCSRTKKYKEITGNTYIFYFYAGPVICNMAGLFGF